MRVEDARARVVLNSKAEPTLEVCLKVSGAWVSASSPSGTSVGKYEVPSWPSGPDVNISVRHAKKILEEEIFPEIKREIHPLDVDEKIEEIDGTGNFSRIGGNTALAVSVAAVKAQAWEEGMHVFEAVSDIFGFKPRPVKPLENFVGGGEHGGGTDIQEFLVAAETEDMEQAVHILSWMYREVKAMLFREDPSFEGALTVESAFVTGKTDKEILSILSKLSDFLSDSGIAVKLGIDVAASSLWNGRTYLWKKEGKERSREEQIEHILEIAEEFDLFYIEDPLNEEDFEGFAEIQKRAKGIVVGDDLFATNSERIVPGIGGIIIKPNQCGTLSRAASAIKKARSLGMKIIVSHRSGETDDNFLSHFAVGVGADYFKAGAAGIRIVKLNELLRICDIL